MSGGSGDDLGAGEKIEMEDLGEVSVFDTGAKGSQAPSVDGWLPIESAPKDSWFLGWSRKEGATRCRWDGTRFQTDLFLAQVKYRGFAEGYPPTDWQPLPYGPTTERRPVSQVEVSNTDAGEAKETPATPQSPVPPDAGVEGGEAGRFVDLQTVSDRLAVARELASFLPHDIQGEHDLAQIIQLLLGCIETLNEAIDTSITSKPPEAAFRCGARGSVGANLPQDCNWPICGCDPYAGKVIAALQECDLLYERSGERRELIEALNNLAGLVAEQIGRGKHFGREIERAIDAAGAALTKARGN